MKKAFAFARVFESDIHVSIKTVDGQHLTYFECRKFKMAPEFAKKWGEKHGYEVEWKANPMTDADQISFEASFTDEYGYRPNGTFPKTGQPW